MRPWIPVITSALLAGVLFADKNPRMSPDQQVLHALNRLTFGPRAADIDEVKRIGLDAWINRQLNPASIPENTTLEAKLRPLDSLRMTTADIVRSYPSRQMLRAMMAGRLELPENPDTRAAVKMAIG